MVVVRVVVEVGEVDDKVEVGEAWDVILVGAGIVRCGRGGWLREEGVFGGVTGVVQDGSAVNIFRGR